jgi:transcription antitermination factor NusA-like protein
MKGSRIHGIVRELGNENIDVINYTDNIQLYITRALSPAKYLQLKLMKRLKELRYFEQRKFLKRSEEVIILNWQDCLLVMS